MECYHSFAQERFASYETRTRGFEMVNATLAHWFALSQAKSAKLYVRGINLTNELAFAHTSFVKNQSPLRGRSIACGMRHAFCPQGSGGAMPAALAHSNPWCLQQSGERLPTIRHLPRRHPASRKC